MSRSLIIGLSVTIAIIFGVAVLFYFNFVKQGNKMAIDAVPNDAAVILEVNDIQETWASINTTDLWKDLKQNDAVEQLNSLLMASDSMINLNADVKRFLTDNKTTISFHTNRGLHLSILFVASVGDYKGSEEFVKWVASVLKGTVSKRVFDKETMYEISDNLKQPLLTIGFRDGLLMLSKDGSLVEASIQKLKYNLNQGTKGEEQAKKLAASGSQMNMYVNYQHLPGLLAIVNKPEYAQVYQYIKSFANWSVLDVSFDAEHIGITGVTNTDDSVFQFLDLFKTQQPTENDLSMLMPENAAYSLQLNFSNYAQFSIDLNEYLQNIGKLESYSAYIDSVEARYNISITDKLVSQIGGTAAIGFQESAGDDYQNQVFGMFQFKSPAVASSIFDSYINAITKRGEDTSAVLMYNNYQIKQLKIGNVFKLFFGQSFEVLNSPFYVLKDNTFIMANSYNTLTFILNEIDNGRTLSKSASYQKHREHKVTANNISVFISPGKNIPLASIFAKDEYISAANKYAYDIKKFEFVEIQYATSSNNTFFTNINIKFNPSFKEETKVLWATKLDTTFEMQPAIVWNSELSQNCILVQDLHNTLYYINNTGKILWKTKLWSKLNSNIFQVDPNKNGNTCYLFSTAKEAHLITSNGKEMYNYPVRFPGKALAGINLFDFYSDSTFQYFVPLDNKTVLGYDLSGKSIQGWNPRRVDANITTKLTSFSLAAGPYLCASSSNDQLKVLPYSVKQPVPLTPGIASNHYQVYSFQADTTQAFIWLTDTTGSIKMYTINNKLELVEKQTIASAPEDVYHSVIQTSGGYAVLAAHHSGFTVFNEKGAKLLSKVYNDSLVTLPVFSHTKEKNPMIGYTELVSEKVNWMSLQGALYPTLPLKGSTPFVSGDIIMNNTNYLVCGDGTNSLILYRLK
jgi:hypothetical protein